MENQHKKIVGYRDLSQVEIDLMNRIKEKGAEMLELQQELVLLLAQQQHALKSAIGFDEKERLYGNSEPAVELRRFDHAEPHRWAAIGKTDIQTGIMALVRAVAQPAV
ncbi:hypothetical protein BCh11DRAFT_06460 [Burkholderia sp. Ch1-1]|nr:hypothetical protein BCh11DRAFT_06460 [Burkholderia sp. Ch1-1]